MNRALIIFGLVSVCSGLLFRGIGLERRGFTHAASVNGRPGYLNTTTNFFEQQIDHFHFGKLPEGGSGLYKQRFLTFDKFYREGGPIFFYTGNEGNVELYANATGLMWENAEEFGAFIVFAEHRYYGQSLPFGADAFNNMRYLSSSQALADYAVLIHHIKKNFLGAKMQKAAVIAFGGSYGGMLSSWMRLKYPGTIDGAIASSAPILAFAEEDELQSLPYWDSQKYWTVVTRDASPAAGSPAKCEGLIRKSWEAMFDLGKTPAGRSQISEIFHMCTPLKSESEVHDLAEVVKVSIDTMAMGDFPYPSSYLTGGVVDLPAFPVREACQQMVATFESSVSSLGESLALLTALNNANNVYANATQDVKCAQLPDDMQFDGIWDYSYCTENLPQETYFTAGTDGDMFFPDPFNATFIRAHCQQKYGVEPQFGWMRAEYGGLDALYSTSNIVFANGLLDPWSSGGVRKNISETVVAIEIEEGAHHVDLFFTDKNDPPCITTAREFHIAHMKRWVAEKQSRQ